MNWLGEKTIVIHEHYCEFPVLFRSMLLHQRFFFSVTLMKSRLSWWQRQGKAEVSVRLWILQLFWCEAGSWSWGVGGGGWLRFGIFGWPGPNSRQDSMFRSSAVGHSHDAVRYLTSSSEGTWKYIFKSDYKHKKKNVSIACLLILVPSVVETQVLQKCWMFEDVKKDTKCCCNAGQAASLFRVRSLFSRFQHLHPPDPTDPGSPEMLPDPLTPAVPIFPTSTWLKISKLCWDLYCKAFFNIMEGRCAGVSDREKITLTPYSDFLIGGSTINVRCKWTPCSSEHL